MITIRQLNYVAVSDLFEGFDNLLDELCEYDPDFTWGDNNHSIVNLGRIQDTIKYFLDNEEELKRFTEYCKDSGLTSKTYVDMEH